MILNGFIYLFDVCVFDQEEAIRRIAVCSTIEEAVEEAGKYSPNLKPDEYIDINPCEAGGIDFGEEPVLNSSTSIAGFGTPDDNGQTVEEYCQEVIRELTLETPPAKPDSIYPKRKKINPQKGKKERPLSEFLFLDDYYEAIRVNKGDKSTVEGYLPVIEEKDYDRVICPKCWETIKKCECKEWSEYFYQIDPMIAEAIGNLNRKGYFTSACCEGHDWLHSEAYISFCAYYDFDISIPKGWEQRGNKIFCRFKLNVEGKETFDDVKERMLNALTDWSKELPYLGDAFIDE